MRINAIAKKSVLALLVSFAAFSSIASANPIVFTAPAMRRVGLNEEPGGNAHVRISAARGEYESFQIVANGGSQSLSNVNVTISDLKGPKGEVIPHTSFTLYREKYVYVDRSSPKRGGPNDPMATGWYPDALIPFTHPDTGKPLSGAPLTAVPFDLKAGANQPIWVDLLVPRGAAAGEYTGTYTVTSNQGETTGTIALKVWNFSLPTAPALQSSFLFFKAGSLDANKELLRNRIAPASANPADQAALKGLGLSLTHTGPFSGADIGRCKMSPAPSVSQFKAVAAAHQPGLLLYNYSADEIGDCPGLYPTIKQWAHNMHQAGIKNLISMSPTPALFNDGSDSGRSAVDIWVVLPEMYNKSKSAIDQAMKKGDAVWSYNTLVQDEYSPKWLIDFDPINFRIQPGFINQSLGLSGLLYWRVDKWPADAWSNVNNFGSYAKANYPGEGMLVYPGQEVGVPGVVASMRLKWIRDGVDDYDYVQMLKKVGREDVAMKISRSVATDWNNWTRDHGKLESAREQLGDMISQAMSGTPATDEASGLDQ